MRYFIVAAVSVVLAGLAGLAGCGGNGNGNGNGTGLLPTPPGPQEDVDVELVIGKKCKECHTGERIENHHFDRAGWERTVNAMIGHGVKITAAERDVVVEFLTERDKDKPKS